MNKKEVATYMIIDSAVFIKKTFKKTSVWSAKYLGITLLISASILVGDSMVNKKPYEQHKISALDLFVDNNQFTIEKPINTAIMFEDENNNKSLPTLRHSYVPIVAEFSEKNIYNELSSEEIKSLNNSLVTQYSNVCNTGIISRLICLKYDKYEEIQNLNK